MSGNTPLLRISTNKRFLSTIDGRPFFWLGDTAWELFHKLDREDAELYLQNRKDRGFNVIQAVALGEDDGIRKPNAYGCVPLLVNESGTYDPTRPDTGGEYSYWDHVDFIVSKAAELGLYIAFLPTWGDKYYASGKGPQVFDEANAKIYGDWIGRRYKDCDNIIWVLGGDRNLDTRLHFNVINGMAEGLRHGDEGRHLITFHPRGDISSSHQVHHESWLDFNMIQSGHGALNIANYAKVSHDYSLIPVKPTIDGEPRYEDHPIGFNPVNGYFDDWDVRVAAYWAVFAGAFGHTYGHHSIWTMCSEPGDYFVMTWKEAIMRPGGTQVQYLKRLIESRPFFDRIPDQNLIARNYSGANYLPATRGTDYAFIYSPNGLKVEVNMGLISGGSVIARWYDPRTGKAAYIGDYANTEVASFIPPSHGRNNDWVLVLDDSTKEYSL